MKTLNTERSKYRMAIDKLGEDIRSGVIAPGSDFFTRKELCEKFNLSLVTAHKVQKGLCDLKLLISRPGRGFIVSSQQFEASAQPLKLKKVRIIGDYAAISDGRPFGGDLIEGIRSECAAQNLEFIREYVKVLENPQGYLNTMRQSSPDEGLVIMLHHDLAPEIITLLMDANIRMVIVDNIFPFRSSVLSDNFDGMEQLMQCAVKHGAKKVLLASHIGLLPSPNNESERIENFIYQAKLQKLDFSVNSSGNYYNLIGDVNNFKPDTVFFTHDDGALHFKNNYLKECRKKPRIFGFDNICLLESGLDELTTYAIDVKAMGKHAVRKLLDSASILSKPSYIRVKGKLLDREIN